RDAKATPGWAWLLYRASRDLKPLNVDLLADAVAGCGAGGTGRPFNPDVDLACRRAFEQALQQVFKRLGSFRARNFQTDLHSRSNCLYGHDANTSLRS